MATLPGLPQARKAGPQAPQVPPKQQAPTQPPRPGDRAPDFLLPDTARTANPLSALVRGAPVALVFVGKPEAQGLAETVRRLEAGGSQVFVLADGWLDAVAAWKSEAGLAATVLVDPQGHVHRDYGVSATPRIVLLDPTQRLVMTAGAADLDSQASEVLDAIAALPELRGEGPFAPILRIPRALDPAFCRELIEIWHAKGNVESGTIGVGAGGRAEASIKHDVKRRRDHHVSDPALFARIRERVLPRVQAEARRAFDADIREVEEFKIVRYDAAEGGFFRPHRDNNIVERAQRRFAMTLNLNAEEHEGGELCFPEYGPRLYKPATGEAVIFSCALLHEARDVTAGSRFTLLSFLLDGRADEHKKNLALWYRQAQSRLESALARMRPAR